MRSLNEDEQGDREPLGIILGFPPSSLVYQEERKP
jgi:hypothetical protein